jgi:RHS repeat-associated protein
MAVGSPVNPSLGAKVLSNETDFALPSASLPVVWSRTYSSYVNAEHGGACGVLGYGWHLALCDIRLELQAERTLLFDAYGRTITFPEALTPGAALHSRSESLWLLRGAETAAWHEETAWRHIPAEWSRNPDCIIVTTGDKSLFWCFIQPPEQSFWLLAEQRDRFGNNQSYKWFTPPSGQQDETPPPMLLGEITDGAGRRYRLHYLSLYPSRLATGSGWRGQAGWLADSGWRLVQVELLEAPDSDAYLNEAARKAFEVAQATLKHPNIPDANGIVLVRYDYDQHTGDLIRIRNRANTVIREFSTRNHLLVSHRTRGGSLHLYEYEADEPGAKVIKQVNENGLTYHFTYLEDEPGSNSTIIQDSLYREQIYSFKGEGDLKRLVKHQRADGSHILYEYDIAGHLTCITNPLGHKTRMLRDGEGRLIGHIDPANRHTRAVYDEAGQLSEYEDAPGRITRRQYDPWGRLVGITYPDGAHEALQYPEPRTCTANLPVHLIDARGGIKRLEWNPAGRLVSFTDCSSKTTHYRYSPWGGLLTETDALDQSTHFKRDQTDKLLSVTLPNGETLRYEYNAQELLTGIIEPDGGKHRLSWDGAERLIERIDAAGRCQRYQYDQAGRLVLLENENGAFAHFTYDIMDRLSREIGFDRRIQRYGYDLAGQLTDKTEESLPTRPMIRYDYDEVGNLIARHIPANGHIKPQTERFEWDESGQLASAYGNGSKVEFTYDRLGRVSAETQTQVHQDGRIWQWKHRQEMNELGVRRQSAYGDLPPVQWLTYGSGHLHGVNLSGFSIDFARDELHREIERNIRTAHSPLLFNSDTAYNALGDISERILEIGGMVHEKKQYRYDQLARLTEINDALGSQIQYTYDKANRLIGSRHGTQTFQYVFDAAGNRVNPGPLSPSQAQEDWAETVRQKLKDPNFNPLAYSDQPNANDASRQWFDNRISELDGIQNTFDAAGNLIGQKRPDGTMLELYYDGAFRLAALTRTNPGGAQVKAWYGYDAFSRRIAKGVTEHGVEKITSYGWDGDRLVHEATEKSLTTIVYTPGSFAPLMRIEQDVKKEEEKSEREQAMQDAMKLVEEMLAAGGMELKKPKADPDSLRVSFFATDHAGTPSKLIDAEGTIIWKADPDDWAAVKNETGVRQPIRFQGQWLDEESGFYYNRHRYYDPKLGRYITQDPIGLSGGENLYAHANGNPIAHIDPLGLDPCPPDGWAYCRETCGKKGDEALDCIQLRAPCGLFNACDYWGCQCGSYENPGTHDPRKPGPNSYKPSKSVLPENHEELWKKSVPDPDEPGKTRWTKFNTKKGPEYHRFEGSNGKWHWNGSTVGETASGQPYKIKLERVPIQIRRLP